MLEFLSGFGNVMGQAAPAVNSLSGILGLLSGIKGENDVYNEVRNQGPTASEARSSALMEALIQPGNSLVKSLSEEERMRSAQEFLSRIRSMQTADRRLQGRGGQPTFFNPERADESLDFLTSRALPQLTQAGMDLARSRIANTAQGLRGNIDTERQRQQDSISALQTHTANRQNILKGIPEIFSQIQGMFNKPWQPQQMEDEFGGYTL